MALKSIHYDYNAHYIYHQLKPEVFFQTIGIEKNLNYNIASAERAVGDCLYLNKNMNLNLSWVTQFDFQLLKNIANIYCQETTARAIERLIDLYARH
jgi:hypothetical protein